MKCTGLTCAFIFLLACSTFSKAAATQVGIGDRVPASLFCQGQSASESWQRSIKLLVLMPERSEYGGMLKLAFSEYFQAQKAFSQHENLLGVKVVYVTGAVPGQILLNTGSDSDCVPIVEPTVLTDLARATGVAMPKTEQSDATVLLLDKDDVVVWRDDAYRAQGEHLKPLESAVKSQLGLSDPVVLDHTDDGVDLQVGDFAPNFSFGKRQSAGRELEQKSDEIQLSELKGKVVLVTFYPAAFSGNLPAVEGSVELKVAQKLALHRIAMMSCSVHIRQIERLSIAPDVGKTNVMKIAVTSSTPELLDAWGRLLDTEDMHYMNDPGYAVAKRYGSYDVNAGYNRRKLFIIDSDGRIAFVDEDYAAGDASKIQLAMDEIIRRTVR